MSRLKLTAIVREAVRVGRRQYQFDRLYARLRQLRTESPASEVDPIGAALSKLFSEHGHPSTWQHHVWHRGSSLESASTLYEIWASGLWAHIEGVVPPSLEPPAFLLPPVMMIQ